MVLLSLSLVVVTVLSDDTQNSISGNYCKKSLYPVSEHEIHDQAAAVTTKVGQHNIQNGNLWMSDALMLSSIISDCLLGCGGFLKCFSQT